MIKVIKVTISSDEANTFSRNGKERKETSTILTVRVRVRVREAKI